MNLQSASEQQVGAQESLPSRDCGVDMERKKYSLALLACFALLACSFYTTFRVGNSFACFPSTDLFFPTGGDNLVPS